MQTRNWDALQIYWIDLESSPDIRNMFSVIDDEGNLTQSQLCEGTEMIHQPIIDGDIKWSQD